MKPFFAVNKEAKHERIAVIAITDTKVLFTEVVGREKQIFEMSRAKLRKDWLFQGFYA